MIAKVANGGVLETGEMEDLHKQMTAVYAAISGKVGSLVEYVSEEAPESLKSRIEDALRSIGETTQQWSTAGDDIIGRSLSRIVVMNVPYIMLCYAIKNSKGGAELKLLVEWLKNLATSWKDIIMTATWYELVRFEGNESLAMIQRFLAGEMKMGQIATKMAGMIGVGGPVVQNARKVLDCKPVSLIELLALMKMFTPRRANIPGNALRAMFRRLKESTGHSLTAEAGIYFENAFATAVGSTKIEKVNAIKERMRNNANKVLNAEPSDVAIATVLNILLAETCRKFSGNSTTNPFRTDWNGLWEEVPTEQLISEIGQKMASGKMGPGGLWFGE